MAIDIAYIVSHGFAARMVMQTDLLGQLVKSGKKVAIIAPDREDANLKAYCAEAGVALYEFNPVSDFWSANYARSRMYFLEDIRSNVALYEKHIYARKFSNHSGIFSWLRPILLMFVHDLKERFPGIKRWYQRREKKHLQSKAAFRVLETMDPRVVISTYPVNFREGMLLDAAKTQRRKTVIHLLSWDNISCKGHFPTLADEYIAWGPIMKEELMQYYQIPEEKIHICGVPHFDVHLESKQDPQPGPYLKALGLDPEKPYLFFGMSSPRFAPHEIDIVEWLAGEVEDNVFGKEMQLVVRPHPQNVQGGMADDSWLPRLQKLHSNKVAVDMPDLVESKMPWSMQHKDMLRLSHLLAGCDVSLNSGSTLSIDALMCGVPVILTSFDGDQKLEYWKSARRLIDYPHLKKLGTYPGILICSDVIEVNKAIKHFHGQPKYLKGNHKKAIKDHCSNFSGNSTARVLTLLNQYIILKTRITAGQ